MIITFSRELTTWVACEDPRDPSRAVLRCVSFVQHKMTDGSWAMLEVGYVGEARPMPRKNLP